MSSEFNILGTSHHLQFGLINEKMAVRLLKKNDVIDTHVFSGTIKERPEELLGWFTKLLPLPKELVMDIQNAAIQVKSILKQDNLKVITIDRKYLHEIISPNLISIQIPDGLPTLPSFLIYFFGLNDLITIVNGHVIEFLEAKEFPKELASHYFDSLFQDFKEIKLSPGIKLSEVLDDDEIYPFKDPKYSRIWLWTGKKVTTRTKFIVSKMAESERNEHGWPYHLTFVGPDNEPPEFKDFLRRMGEKEGKDISST